MSDNMKWPEKKEEYGIKGNTFNEGKVIGWNACHEEFIKVIKEQIQISLFESLHPLNQPAEQNQMKQLCDCEVQPCEIHPTESPRLAPLDENKVYLLLMRETNGFAPQSDNTHTAEGCRLLAESICKRFGTSQLEALGEEAVIEWFKKTHPNGVSEEPLELIQEICNKFAQPKEVKVSVEDIQKVISDCIKDEINKGYKTGGIYTETVATAILNFLNARGK